MLSHSWRVNSERTIDHEDIRTSKQETTIEREKEDTLRKKRPATVPIDSGLPVNPFAATSGI